MIWHCGRFDFDTSTPIVMGILNITPDSFSDGGLYLDADAAVEHALAMVDAGAAIVDVGGESTRPGSDAVDPAEEWERIGAVIAALAGRGLCVSVDRWPPGPWPRARPSSTTCPASAIPPWRRSRRRAAAAAW